jgi:histidinol dehydrogenase
MEIIEGFEKAKIRLTRQPSIEFGAEQQRVVAQILHDVRARGDAAIHEYTFKFEKVKADSLEISRSQISEAKKQVSEELTAALTLAAERIREFHQEQLDSLRTNMLSEKSDEDRMDLPPEIIKKMFMTRQDCGQIMRPVNRVGIYAPGGTAAYPSTILMTAIPARVAGVKEIILCTPRRDNGAIPPMTLLAADLAGVDRIFGAGGAQAIAAMAYGTESVPKVDKICGPGNQYVVMAKKAVFGFVDIDALQGPSEILIVADDTAKAAYCAADLLAQAEHDPLAQIVLVTTSPRLAGEVREEVHKQLATLPRNEIASGSLEIGGVIAIVNTREEAIELANRYAPEHLELMLQDAGNYLDKIINAGCVFIDENSPVPLGDYVVGPSHSLPTGGTARFSSPLNVLDFIKLIDVIKVKKPHLPELGRVAITIARAEGLEAHARAIEKRLT